MNKYSIAIIAGGMSRRFGSDKTLALLNNKPLIEHTAENAKQHSTDVMVISKDIRKYDFLQDVRFAQDIYEQQCPLVGLLTAFDNAQFEHVLLISADMPLFNFDIADKLYAFLNGADVCVPDINGKLYPCAAVYSKKSAPVLKEMYAKKDYKLMNSYEKLSTVKPKAVELVAEQDKTSFLNINTPADLEELKKLSGLK